MCTRIHEYKCIQYYTYLYKTVYDKKYKYTSAFDIVFAITLK